MKKILIILIIGLVLLTGCFQKMELPPSRPTYLPPAGKLTGEVIEILDYLDEYEEPNHFAILKINSIICINCFNEKYKEIKIGDELIFYFDDDIIGGMPYKTPPVPGMKVGDKIKGYFGGVEDPPVKIPNTNLVYNWEVINYQIIN